MKNKYLINSINIYIFLIESILLTYLINKIYIISNITNITISLSIILIFIIAIKAYLNKNKNVYNTGAFIVFLINILLLNTIITINNEYINYNQKESYTYNTYDIYVLKKNTKYHNITKLNNKKIGILNNNLENVKESLNKIINAEIISYEDEEHLASAIENGEIQSFIIRKEDINKLENSKTNILNKVKIIYSQKIKEI